MNNRNYEGVPMHIEIARQIIDTLAQGINPITGEAMGEDSPYNAPPVIRALHAVSRALEGHHDFNKPAEPARKKNLPVLPANAGKPWSTQEDSALVTAFEAGIAIKQIASELSRTSFAVEQRLVRHGKLQSRLPIRG